MSEHNVVEAGRVTASRTAHRSASKRGAKEQAVTAQERERMIATAAYYRAERRGFAPGQEVDDWIEAETEIERQLRRD